MPKIKFLCQGIQKLSPDRQTHRQYENITFPHTQSVMSHNILPDSVFFDDQVHHMLSPVAECAPAVFPGNIHE